MLRGNKLRTLLCVCMSSLLAVMLTAYTCVTGSGIILGTKLTDHRLHALTKQCC